MRPQLHSDKSDKFIFNGLQQQLALIKAYQQKGSLVLPFLDSFVVHAACRDPGTSIVPGLVLPALEAQVVAQAAKEGEKLRAAAQKEVSIWAVQFACRDPGTVIVPGLVLLALEAQVVA